MSELALFDETKFNQAIKLAGTLAKSSIVPSHFRGKPEDVFACLVLGAELGFQPMQSLNAIVMIQGNATLKAQTMLALVRSRCPKAIIEITEEGDTVSCLAKRDERDLGYKASWNKDKAYDAGFAKAWDKENKKWITKDNWVKQPKTMSRWRSVSEACRVVFPDILQGLYASEEIEDLPPIVHEDNPESLKIASEISENFKE